MNEYSPEILLELTNEHVPVCVENIAHPVTMYLDEKEIAARDFGGDRQLDGLVRLQFKRIYGEWGGESVSLIWGGNRMNGCPISNGCIIKPNK